MSDRSRKQDPKDRKKAAKTKTAAASRSATKKSTKGSARTGGKPAAKAKPHAPRKTGRVTAASAKSSKNRSVMTKSSVKTPAKADAKAPQKAAAAAKTPVKKPIAKPVAAKPVTAKVAAPPKPVMPAPKPAAKAPPVAPRSEEQKKPLTQRQGFKTNEFVVYPAHGVGQIMAIEEQEIAGARLELFVISFMKDKMTLRVPTAKVANVGMRKLSEPALVKKALETLKGRARIKRTMWSRRAQEYEAKINSGDIVAIAEVVRDLYRSESQPEQSYSERQLYEAALDRLAREIVVVQHMTETEAIKEIEAQLAKSPRRGSAKAESEGDADDMGDDSVVTDEAA